METRYLALALAITFGAGLVFYAAMKWPRRARRIAFAILLAAVLGSPWIVPPGARLSRLIATIYSVTIAVKLYDHFQNADARFIPARWIYVISLFHPFELALRRVLREKPPPRSEDVRQMLFCFAAGLTATALIVVVFCVHWRRFPFVLEHCAKATSVFLMIQFLPNALASAFRLLNIPSTNFAGPFFLARTPAEFWRLYNRPVNQFFQEYVFKPAHGRDHPWAVTFVTFLLSGVIHEYVFDIPAPHMLGMQMLFFVLQGIAATATIRLRPRGWMAIPAMLLTLAFNLATVYFFLICVNAVLPFYVDRSA